MQVTLRNPLQITLLLLRVRLLWNFQKQDGETVSNIPEREECDRYVETKVVESISLAPYSSQQVKNYWPFLSCMISLPSLKLGIFFRLFLVWFR